jgi:hypothetical protein
MTNKINVGEKLEVCEEIHDIDSFYSTYQCGAFEDIQCGFSVEIDNILAKIEADETIECDLGENGPKSVNSKNVCQIEVLSDKEFFTVIGDFVESIAGCYYPEKFTEDTIDAAIIENGLRQMARYYKSGFPVEFTRFIEDYRSNLIDYIKLMRQNIELDKDMRRRMRVSHPYFSNYNSSNKDREFAYFSAILRKATDLELTSRSDILDFVIKCFFARMSLPDYLEQK